MHPRANYLDSRSPSFGLSSIYLSSLLLVSAVSIEGLIAAQAACAYTAIDSSEGKSHEIQVSLVEESNPEDVAQTRDEVSEDLQFEQTQVSDFDHTLSLQTIENGIEVKASSIFVESDLSEYSSEELDEFVRTDLETDYSETSDSDQVLIIVDAGEQSEIDLFSNLENLTPEDLVEESSIQESSVQTDATLLPILEVAQMPEEPEEVPEFNEQAESEIFDNRLQAQLQAVYILEGDESSARGRLTASYAFTPNVLVGTTIDLVGGEAFTSNPEEGLNVQELFLSVSPATVPNFRVTLGMIDLTSYFDRNSFAKDAATQFFNPVFQTNPALVAAGIGSRPGVLVNWDLTDNFSVRGAAFSSDRDLDDFAFDAAAAEVAFRFGTAIIRGTYSTSRDAGQNTGFDEIFQFERGDDDFGLEPGDREIAYGLNAEVFIPELNLGLFGRYGWYQNEALDEGGNTFSFGLNALDLFFADDRLGLAYGRNLSNVSLRDNDDEIPDVVELFYDVRVLPYLRLGVTLQGRNEFSETIAGFRVRGDLDLAGLWR